MKKILISCFLFLSIHALFAQGSKTTKPSKTQSQPNMDDLQKMMDDAMKDLTPEQKQMANDYIQKSMSGTIENQKNPDANKEYEEYLKDEEAEQANIGTISAKVIGIGGGNITSQSGKFSFDIPAGALTENIEFKLQETAGNSMSCGNGCKLLPSGLGFLKPVTFTTKYSKRDITGTAPELLIIIDKGDNIVTKSVVDKNNKSVSIKISNSGNQWITTAAARLVLEPEIREVSRGQTIEIKLKDIDYDPTGKYDEDLYFGIHADRTIDILDSFTITKWKLNEKTAMVLNDKYGSLVKYQKNSVLYTAPQALPLLDRMVTISVELEQNRTKQKVILITYLFLLADDYFILKIDAKTFRGNSHIDPKQMQTLKTNNNWVTTCSKGDTDDLLVVSIANPKNPAESFGIKINNPHVGSNKIDINDKNDAGVNAIYNKTVYSQTQTSPSECKPVNRSFTVVLDSLKLKSGGFCTGHFSGELYDDRNCSPNSTKFSGRFSLPIIIFDADLSPLVKTPKTTTKPQPKTTTTKSQGDEDLAPLVKKPKGDEDLAPIIREPNADDDLAPIVEKPKGDEDLAPIIRKPKPATKPKPKTKPKVDEVKAFDEDYPKEKPKKGEVQPFD